MKLKNLQSQFTTYCKTGSWDESQCPMPTNIERYRAMVRHNFNNTLAKAYPIAQKAMGKEHWLAFVDAFLATYTRPEAHFLEFPKAALDFEIAQQWGMRQGLPWLSDLLLFEWTQIELFHKPDSENPIVTGFSGDLSIPVRLQEDWELLTFTYPVYRKDWAELSGQYFLLLYRDARDFEVYNLELNPLLAAFWCALVESPTFPVLDILRHLLAQYQIELTEAVLSACRGFLVEMGARGLVAI